MSIRVAGRGFARSPMVKIYDNTLTATGKFDVTGIPPGYNRMKIFLWARSDVSVGSDLIECLFNGDSTSANYRAADGFHGSSHGGSGTDVPRAAIIPGAVAPANYFGSVEMLILDYSGALNKQLISFGGERESSVTIYNRWHTMHWENTAVINQITIQTDNDPTDELIAGSQLKIWLYR